MSEGESLRMSAMRNVMRSPRARATGALLLVGGMLTYVGVAGAAADHTVKAIGAGTSSHWDAPAITVQTGQSVMWDFSDASLPTPLSTHNVVSTNAVATDPRWEGFVFPGPGEFDQASTGTSVEYTFYKQGEYQYVCTLHGGPMQGTVTVEGEDLPIPTPTATPTATPTVTATATPTVTPAGTPPPADDHTQTPAPKPAADTTKPTLSSLKLKGRKRAATVSFTLSENATVTVQIRKRGAKKVLRTVRLQANAGKRSVVLRSSKLRKGRYTVTLTARDAMGNASAAANASLRIRK
jgi:plastocyanin